MKLLTKEIEKKLISNNEDAEDPICIAKFFNPTGIGRWFAINYYPDEKKFFGYVSLFGDYNDELGYFSLDELEEFKGKFGLGIERDLSFQPTKLSEIKERYTK